MKIGTLVKLHMVPDMLVNKHGIGVVIRIGTEQSRLVSFPKLGAKQWRHAHFLKRMA